jgi:hypothetical protein
MSKARWRHPTAAKEAIVANVNMDEDEMLWPLEDIIAFGRNIPAWMQWSKKPPRAPHLQQGRLLRRPL